MSDARPKLKELARELEELSWADVKAMAIQLDMGFATLRKIEERYREISDRVLSAMETWLDTDKQASWKKLVKALNDTSKIVLAQNIEKKYVLAPAATFTATASPPTSPAADATLTSGDAITVVEELLEAQNRSKFLGLKLNLPTHVVEGIHDQYSDPQTRLLHVIEEFLKGVEPRPTWRVIIEALRSPSVKLPRLALRLEEKYCTCTTPPAVTTPPHPPTQRTPPPSSQHCRLPSLSGKPTLPQLMNFPTQNSQRINIIQKISTNYRNFGILLLNDDCGEITDTIIDANPRKPNEITSAILTKWLCGCGRDPRSWATLVEVLDIMGNVEELVKALRNTLQ